MKKYFLIVILMFLFSINVYADELPADYISIPYLASSGTQYINTGINANSNLKINALVSGDSTSFGVLYGGGVGWENHYIQGECDSFSYFAYGNNVDAFYNDFYNYSCNVLHDKNKIYINNSLKLTLPTSTFSTSFPIYIYAFNRSNTVDEYGTYKLVSFKIYDNDSLVRDFLPVYKISTSEYGLFDNISNSFFTNLGTGSFFTSSSFIPPEPEPEEPDPGIEDEEVIIPDTTLDNFYSIYFDKLTSLSNFATENKFILSAITILLFICCLELFLYLVRRRKT